MFMRLLSTAYLVTVIAMALLASGCDGEVSAPGASTPVPDATDTPAGRETERAGVAISRSDVSGIADTPISSGEVLFIPDEREADLSDTAGVEPSDPTESRYSSFEVAETRLVELDGAAAQLGDDGRFSVNVQAGGYFVCLSNAFPSHTLGPPYSVIGCDIAVIDGDGEVTVFHGEGGVEATPD